MATSRHFCTYFDHHYLPQGLALYHSLLRHCPEARLFVLCLSGAALADLQARRLPGLTAISLADFEAGDTALAAAKGNRNWIEYIFTCTPSFCRWVLRAYPEIELLTYLDADLYFFSNVEPMFAELGAASIGIIPHNFTSDRYLKFGRFNVGWVSFRRDANGLACVDWWREQCLEWCRDQVEPTRFADQKYLDQWPSRFGGVHIFAHPGANLARWNIGRRRLEARSGRLTVDGQPLIFFHFASFKQVTPWLFESNFSTHLTRPSRLVREHIYGRYIAELRHLVGDGLPRGPRRSFLQGLGLHNLSGTTRRLLLTMRSIVFWDYILVLDLDELDNTFAGEVGAAARITSSPGRPKRRIWFAYADATLHSGQKEASRLIYDSLDRTEWKIKRIVMPGFDHNQPGLGRWLRYAYRLLLAWLKFLPVLFTREAVLHLAIGQTRMALMRDGLPLKALALFNPSARIAVSLQGSLFMDWRPDDAIARSFVGIARAADCLTLLGPNQRRQIIALGVPEQNVVICNNTCGTQGLEAEAVERKHAISAGEPVRVLFLSTLIETKGYPEFLEALLALARQPGPAIEAVLCGRVLVNQYSARFPSTKLATEWIRRTVADLNRSERVRIEWIDGADGEQKWQLYRRAQVLVLPTVYQVEAQPIVLIEGMAHGCALITSRAGEITAMFDDPAAAVLLPLPDVDSIARAIETLVGDPARRRALGLAGRALFEAKFSPARYAEQWRGLLTGRGTA